MAAYTNEALVTAADSADGWSTPSDPAPGGAAACFPGGLQAPHGIDVERLAANQQPL